MFTADRYEEKRLTLYGDSIAKGLYTKEGKIFKTARPAAEIYAGRAGFILDNRSAFGLTLEKCCRKGYFEGFLRRFEPGRDVLAISLGGNDCDHDWKEVAADPFAFHRPHTPLPLFEELIQESIDLLAKGGVKPVFTTLVPVDAERYFKNVICARADGNEVMKFFEGDLSNITRHQEAYSAAVMRAALTNGCPLADIRSEFLLRRDLASLLADDGIHPNAEGQALIAECILRAFPPRGGKKSAVALA